MWTSGVDWDEDLPLKLKKKWEAWMEELPDLENIVVPRCLHSFKASPKQEIHVFCDASEEAYASAVYVVSEADGQHKSTLALARARVSPKAKKLTIPRLELIGALLGLRLVKKLCKALDIPITEVYFWLDAMDVLCWIRNDVSRFQAFVAHPISEIRDATSPDQWHHVPGPENPADFPTRGMTAKELGSSTTWWCGPPFLCEDLSSWPTQKHLKNHKMDEAEFRKERPKKTMATAVSDGSRLHPDRFSKWLRLVRVTAWVKRFVSNMKRRIATTRAESSSSSSQEVVSQMSELQPEEIEVAEKFWIRKAQEEAFGAELEQLRQHDTSTNRENRKRSDIWSKKSSVGQLCPFTFFSHLVTVCYVLAGDFKGLTFHMMLATHCYCLKVTSSAS